MGLEEMIKLIEKEIKTKIDKFSLGIDREDLKLKFKFNIDKTNLSEEVISCMEHIEKIGIYPNILQFIRSKSL